MVLLLLLELLVVLLHDVEYTTLGKPMGVSWNDRWLPGWAIEAWILGRVLCWWWGLVLRRLWWLWR
jgi:hypothetical protein